MRGDLEQVAGAHAGGEQRLVGVAEGRVGDADGRSARAARRRSPPGRARRAAAWTRPAGPRPGRPPAASRAGRRGSACSPLRLVDGDVGEVAHQARPAVGGGARGEQVRVLGDERRRHPALAEVRLVEQGHEERDVGRDAAHAELGQGAAGPAHRGGEVAPAAGDLDQQRVEVRADLRAGVGRAAVEPHARARRRAVGRDHPDVGAELVGRVLGGDPALQREAVQRDRVLRETQVLQGLPRRDAHLARHEVDVGDLLGDRVLHLDAGVHLDEVVVAVAVEQELDGAGVDVADLLGELHGVRADRLAGLRRQVRGRRDLDDLLVPALHRAVALEQVHDVPGAVGEDLHLDVPRVDHGLLEDHRRVAEGAATPRSWPPAATPGAPRAPSPGASRARRRRRRP